MGFYGAFIIYGRGEVSANTVRTESKFPPGNLLFVNTVEKFQIPEYISIFTLSKDMGRFLQGFGAETYFL